MKRFLTLWCLVFGVWCLSFGVWCLPVFGQGNPNPPLYATPVAKALLRKATVQAMRDYLSITNGGTSGSGGGVVSNYFGSAGTSTESHTNSTPYWLSLAAMVEGTQANNFKLNVDQEADGVFEYYVSNLSFTNNSTNYLSAWIAPGGAWKFSWGNVGGSILQNAQFVYFTTNSSGSGSFSGQATSLDTALTNFVTTTATNAAQTVVGWATNHGNPVFPHSVLFADWDTAFTVLTNGDAIDPSTNQIYGPSMCMIGHKLGLYYGSWTHPGFSPVTTNYGGIKAAFAFDISALQSNKVGFVLQPSTTPGDWDYGYVESPRVRNIAGQYVMTYFGGTNRAFEGYYSALGLATSPDGTNWTKCPSNPVIQIGGPNTFDSYQIFTGDIMQENGTNFIVYVAWGSPHDNYGRLGMAYSTNLFGPYTKYPGNRSQSDYAFGTNSTTVYGNGHPIPGSFNPGDPTLFKIKEGGYGLISGSQCYYSTNLLDWTPTAEHSSIAGLAGISFKFDGVLGFEPAVVQIFDFNGPAMMYSHATTHSALYLLRPKASSVGQFDSVVAGDLESSGNISSLTGTNNTLALDLGMGLQIYGKISGTGGSHKDFLVVDAKRSLTNLAIINNVIYGNGAGLTNVVNATATNTPLTLGKNVVYLRDDFIGGANAAPGDLPWITQGSPTMSRLGDSARWGVRTTVSGSTSNTTYGSYLVGTSATDNNPLPLSSIPWKSTFIYQPMNTNGVEHAVGFFPFASSYTPSAPRGTYLRYDDVLGDTNWVLIVAISGNLQTNFTFAAANPGGLSTNWQTIVFESFTAGEVTVSIDGGTRMTNTFSGFGGSPGVFVIPRDGSNTKSNRLDYFDFMAYPTR